MVRIVYIFIYIWISVLISGCGGQVTPYLGGDRISELALYPVTKEFTLSKDDPKKLVMVIIADPTRSMGSTQAAIENSIPGFTQGLIDTNFTYDIYCSNTSYNGGSDSEIISIKSSSKTTSAQLQQSLKDCISVAPTDEIGDERGLEAARKTWENILAKGLVSKDAVKLTMIVTNEDDCSRDLGLYPTGDEHNCLDQNIKSSPNPLHLNKPFPMTDRAYADDSRLFGVNTYADFFKERLNYVATSNSKSTPETGLDKVLVQRGHIFAPVIIPPPDAVGRQEAEQCRDVKTALGKKLVPPNTVMSYGMRYFQVAEELSTPESKNPIYSLCEEFDTIFSEINTSVQKEVGQRKFNLTRRPKNPDQLQIHIVRSISDVSLADKVLERMQLEDSRSKEANQWVKKSETPTRVGNKNVTRQIWTRILDHNSGFKYVDANKELVFDDGLYQPFNDKLQVMSYDPAGFDGNEAKQ